MKKIIISLFLAGLAAAAYGCGDKKDQTTAESTPQEFSETEELIIDPDGNVLSEMPTERVRDIEEISDFEYETLDSGVLITKYTGSSAEVTVPAEINDIPVIAIGFYAFEAQYSVTTVTLPESVTSIGEGAFMDCASLKSINIPEAVTGIDRGAFVGCTSLESLVIPANVSYIHEEAFTACESMTSLTINNPDLKYESWGLEELPGLTVYAAEGSDVLKWAKDMGLSAEAL